MVVTASKNLTTLDSRQFSGDKILLFPERIAEWLATGSTRPVTYELDLTNVCNHHCPECAGWNTIERTKDVLSEDLAIDIMSQIEKFGGKAVTFTGGGEPLAHPRFSHIWNSAPEGLDLALITNGSLLGPEIAAEIVQRATWIRVSLDAVNEETHKQTHGVSGKFERTIRNISELVWAKEVTQSGCTIGLGFLTGLGIMDTDEYLDSAAKIGNRLRVDYVQFRPFHHQISDIAQAYVAAKKRWESESFKILWSQEKYLYASCPRGYDQCYGHEFCTVIGADGNMYLCCHMIGKPEFALGNLYQQLLASIWHGEQRKKTIASIKLPECIPHCRCDPFNRLLWQIKNKQREHCNFL